MTGARVGCSWTLQTPSAVCSNGGYDTDARTRLTGIRKAASIGCCGEMEA